MNRLGWVFAVALVTMLQAPVALAEKSLLLRVPFAPGQDTLGPEATRRLENALPILKQDYTGLQIEIAGHTDATLEEAYNLELSRRRIDTVYQYLESNGMPMQGFRRREFGESRPRADNDTPSGRAQNRRVELWLIEPSTEPGDLTHN